MLSSRSRLIFATAVLAPVLLYWGAARDPGEPAVQQLEGDAANTDFYLRDALIQQFDTSGRLHQELRSPELEHYPEPGLLEASEPRLLLVRENSSDRVRVEAARGMLLDNNERVDLSGDVQLFDEPETGDVLHLETPSLTLFPEREYAETEERVRLVSPQGEMVARGMKAYLNERKVELMSDVEGRYEAN